MGMGEMIGINGVFWDCVSDGSEHGVRHGHERERKAEHGSFQQGAQVFGVPLQQLVRFSFNKRDMTGCSESGRTCRA